MITNPLIGHDGPLTFLKYNRQGDMLFSCAKDKKITLWFTDNGRQIGSFMGHSGAVYQCDITYDSSYLVTASADCTLRIWEVETGKQLDLFEFNEPCRATSLSLGDDFVVTTTDAFMGIRSAIRIRRFSPNRIDKASQDLLRIDVDSNRITRAIFYDVNRKIITAHGDGSVRKWDVETGKHLQTAYLHKKIINDLKLSEDWSHFITASGDKSAKLVDSDSLETIRDFQAERPVNSADMSPIFEHVVLAGGQDAEEVTRTVSSCGKFESIFFHKIFAERFGFVKGHFGPINAVAFSPDGRSFSTGGEDGYVRLHHFDHDYFLNAQTYSS